MKLVKTRCEVKCPKST